MPDFDYPYEDDPAGRRPEHFTPASDTASGYSPLARFQARRQDGALDAAVKQQHARWETEGVDPDAADPEEVVRIERANENIARQVEAFATEWLGDEGISRIILNDLPVGVFAPGPGVE